MATIKTFNKIVKEQILNAIKLKKTISIGCEGRHSIGKTESVTSTVKALIKDGLKVNFVVKNLAQISDDDFCGYPIPQIEICNTNGDCTFVPIAIAETLIKVGYKPTMNYRTYEVVPQWVSRLDNSLPTVLFLDDYTRATKRVVNATMELVNKGKYGEWGLAPGSVIILSTNPEYDEEESYQVTVTDAAQKTRYLNIPVEFNFQDWMDDFAINYFDNYLKDKRVVPFLSKNRELMTQVRDYASNSVRIGAREITNFFTAISCYPDWSNDESLTQIRALGSSLGDEFSNLFTIYAKSNESQLLSIDEMNKLKDSEFDDYIEEVTKGRHDISVLIIQRYATWIKNRPFDSEVDKAILRLFRHNKSEYSANEGLDKGMLGDYLFMLLHKKLENGQTIFKLLSAEASEASKRYFTAGI